MSKLVEFLLARAETHPEEFYEDRKSDVKHHWMHYVKQYKKFMTEEEYKAIWGKVSAINLEYAMEQVTNKLLTPEPEADYMTAFGQPTKIVASATQIEMIKQLYAKQQEEIRERMRLDMYKGVGSE